MPGFAPGIFIFERMNRKSAKRFSDKIMLKKGAKAR
ncbi:hypothetical protein ACVIW0_007711 [Bradyrhizobium sp. USDA 4454]